LKVSTLLIGFGTILGSHKPESGSYFSIFQGCQTDVRDKHPKKRGPNNSLSSLAKKDSNRQLQVGLDKEVAIG
jgi:hypothetical protein